MPTAEKVPRWQPGQSEGPMGIRPSQPPPQTLPSSRVTYGSSCRSSS